MNIINNEPYWYKLIKYWVVQRQRTGLTIPFIIGAYNLYIKEKNEPDETIENLLTNIVNSDIAHPISVFNCDTIGEYVLTSNKMSGIELKNNKTNSTTFIITFSAEILGKNLKTLFEKFETKYNQRISESKYSKNNLHWTLFTENDITLIKEAFS